MSSHSHRSQHGPSSPPDRSRRRSHGRSPTVERDTLDSPKSRIQRILLKSVPLRIPSLRCTGNRQSRPDPNSGALPIRLRIAFVLLNVLDLTLLGLLGFHPHAQEYVAIDDKILHFFGFFFATALFYGIWDVDESARRIWFWRYFPLILSAITCFLFGSIGSEFVQSLLPYKTFDFFDIVANMLGSALGLFLAYHAERRYRTRRELERLYQPLDADDEDAFAMDLEYGIGEDEDDDDDDDDDEDERSKRAFGGGSLSSKEDSKDRSSSDGDAQRTSQDNSVPKASGGHGTSSS